MFKLLDYTLKSGPFELSFSRLIISHFPFECFDSRGLGISKSMMTALLWWAWSRCTNISIKTVYKLVLKKGRVEEGGVLYVRGNSAASETRDSQLPDDALKKSWSILGPFFSSQGFTQGGNSNTFSCLLRSPLLLSFAPVVYLLPQSQLLLIHN